MEREYLLINSLPLMIAMIVLSSSNLLRIYTPMNAKWMWSIIENLPLSLTLALLSKIILLYKSSLTKDVNFHSSKSGAYTFLETYPLLYLWFVLFRIIKDCQMYTTFFWLYTKGYIQRGNTRQQQNHAKKMFQKYLTVILKCNITFIELWNSILTN